MARGGSRSSSRSPPPRNATFASRPSPAPTAPMQAPQAASGGMMSGIMGTVVQGMAFGAGSEVAHQAVRSVMGGSSHSQPQQQQMEQAPQSNQVRSNPCQQEVMNFSSCIQSNDNLAYCQSFSDMLKSCKQTNNLL